MLYLIYGIAPIGDLDSSKRSGNHELILKIGYTKNPCQREYHYSSLGNFIGFLDTRNGTREDEKLFHQYLSAYSYPIKNEWFYNRQEVKDAFKNLSLDDLYSWQFKNRDSISIYPEFEESFLQRNFSFYEKGNVSGTFNSFDTSLYRKYWHSSFMGLQNAPVHIQSAVKTIFDDPSFENRIKYYCEFCETHSESDKEALNILLGDPSYSEYYKFYGGTQRMVKYSFREALLKQEIFNSSQKSESLPEKLDKIFIPGNKYTFKEIKESLRELYKSFGITSTPKASDLEDYFEVKYSKITINKKRENGYLIISKK